MCRFSMAILLSIFACSGSADDQIQYQTSYLQNGQEVEFALADESTRNTHRITLEGKLGGKGTLHLDGNACATNGFGDTNGCTRVYYPPLEVELQYLKVDDPLGLSRKLYAVNTFGKVKNYTIRLVIPADVSAAPRLLLNSHMAPEIVLRTLTLEPGAGNLGQTDGGKGDTKVVTIAEFSFSPPIVTIHVGDSIKWVNQDSSIHTATRDQAPKFDTGSLSQGEEKTIRFNDSSGESGFEYFCSPHPFMKGRVVVLPAPSKTDDTERRSKGLELARKNGCLKCHTPGQHKVGPAYSAIADRYRDSAKAGELLKKKILGGGKGNWSEVTGGVLMPPHARSLSDGDVEELIAWLLSQ